MSIRSWIRSAMNRPVIRPTRRGLSRTRLGVVGLEDRTVPAPIKVTTFLDVIADDGQTSLREAITQAATVAGDDSIQLPAGEHDLSLGQLAIDDASGTLTIKGVDGIATIDAQGASRVVTIATGSTAVFRDLTLTGGNAILQPGSAKSAIAEGGGILNFGTVTLQGTTVSGNYSDFGGGGIANYGLASLHRSSVDGNTAKMNAGGIYNLNSGTLTVQDSTVNGNSAPYGGGIASFGTITLKSSSVSFNHGVSGGGFNNSGTITMLDCTINGNTAVFGGGIANFGTISIKNSTISGNVAINQGGGIVNAFGTLTLQGSTVSGNTAPNGGGIVNYYFGTLILIDSIISGNTDGDIVYY